MLNRIALFFFVWLSISDGAYEFVGEGWLGLLLSLFMAFGFTMGILDLIRCNK